uniref:Anaphase-promoting complex subunit 4 n=1 Tax=Megaselia scalaris TaxID=36166 RepID=T1GSZ5_MEGSC
MGYRCIQDIVGNPVQQTTINLFYLLNTLQGAKLNHFFYGDLLVPGTIDTALSKCVALIMKAVELQLVVDSCAMDMKAFWSWLSVALVSITDETITDDSNQMSQEGRMNLAEILNNIEEYFSLKENGNGRSKFNMEKIGQYLKHENLKESYTAEMTENNSWLKWLDENKCLENCPKIYMPAKKLSLVQTLDEFTESVLNIFKNAEVVLSKNFVLKKYITLGTGLRNPVFGKFKHSELNLIDLKFYNEEIISICLSAEEEDKKLQTYFVQFSLDLLKHKWIPRQFDGPIDLSNMVGNDVATAFFLELADLDSATKVENDSVAIEVSGSRKVASILSDTPPPRLTFND